jgi:hypothetical protein
MPALFIRNDTESEAIKMLDELDAAAVEKMMDAYVSLKETHYTTTGIKASGFFSVNLPSPDLAEKTDFCGVVSGKTTDKSELFTSFYDESGRAPMIQECPKVMPVGVCNPWANIFFSPAGVIL